MKLDIPNEEWFTNAIRASELEDLAKMGNSLIDHDLLSTISEKWHNVDI